jgi:Septum formation
VQNLVGGGDIPAGESDVFALEVGDCLDDAGDTEVLSVPVVDCSEPHDLEAYFARDMDDGDYPGPEAIQEFGDDTCGAAFEDFVGLPESETTLTWTYYSPLEDGWANGDREILCLAADTEGTVTGSLEGAGADHPLG